MLGEPGRARSTSLFDVPLVVLARGRPLGGDEMPPSWSQADPAALSRTGALITALRSGHFVHHDEPALVTSAVRQLVEGWQRSRFP